MPKRESKPSRVTESRVTDVAPNSPAGGGARPRKRRSFIGDVTAGALLGDFARDLGIAGATTQAALGFVPLIGSVCAVRDLTADLRHHDRVGALLNALALIPFIGGFSKTFEVIRSSAHIGHAVHITYQQAERERQGSDHR